jgi:predicted RND superfamily exporter protein
VAHSVHILSEFRARLAENGDRREAARETLRLVGTPCLLTSLTTAVGFLAMIVSPIKAIAHMAVYSAAGVFAAFALSVTLLMFFLSLGRRERGPAASPEERLRAKGGRHLNAGLEAVARFVIRRRVALLVAFGAVFVLSVAGISRLRVDSNWLDDFSDRVPLKGDTTYIDEVMGGMGNLVYLFDAGEPGGVKNPALLGEMDALQREAGEQEIVKKTYSLGDVLKDLNQAFHEGDPGQHTLPDSRELVAQYLLLYESSGGEEVEEYVSSDFARANLELRLKITSSSEIADVVDGLDEHLRANPLVASQAQITGIGALWLQLLDYITVSQIQGFLLAFSAIAAMMCFIFGSLKTGLISMIPNLSPVFLTLGVMGWFDIPLDYNKLFIATVAIGIAVDDTIHLMTRFHHEFLATRDYRRALVEAVRDVGRALFITSVALIAGFLVFLLSVMNAQATFGVLLASTIFTALIADFLLMPALVLTVKPWGPEGGLQSDALEAPRRAA